MSEYQQILLSSGTFFFSLPPLSIPQPSIFLSIMPDAFVIAVVIFATNVSLSKMLAKKHGYSIDANQVCPK